MSASQAPARAVPRGDLRGFRYALAPLQQRQQWALERLQLQLAEAGKSVMQAQGDLAEIELLHQQAAAAAAWREGGRIDPSAHRRSLAYLLQLGARATAARQRRDELLAEQQRLRAACAALQLRLEGLEQHRHEAAAAHVREVARGEATEQDRDWLARRPRASR